MSDGKAYRANFLWPPDEGSAEQAGYEFANGKVEEYQQLWWGILLERVKSHVITNLASQASLTDPCVGCEYKPSLCPNNETWYRDNCCQKYARYLGALSEYAKGRQDACSNYDYVADALIYAPAWYARHAGERVECPECGSDLGRWPS